VLSRLVIRCVECCGGRVGVFGRFFAVWSLVVSVCGSCILFVGCDCMNVEVMDRCMYLE